MQFKRLFSIYNYFIKKKNWLFSPILYNSSLSLSYTQQCVPPTLPSLYWPLHPTTGSH